MRTSDDPEEVDVSHSAMANLAADQVVHNSEEMLNYLHLRQSGNLSQEQPNEYNISAGASRPGTVDSDTLDVMLTQANQTFVKTRTFKDIRRSLEKNCHVTVCGASGEGKTTIALMLGQKYRQQGYELMFVNRADVFDLGSCISAGQKICFIFDDIFGFVGQTTDLTYVQSLCNSLKMHIDHNSLTKKGVSAKAEHYKQGQGLGLGGDDKVGTDKTKQSREQSVRVIFTAKTYHFMEAMSKMHYQRLSMFNMKTVVDLTTDPDTSYSHQEKKAMFQKHRDMHPRIKLGDFVVEDVVNQESTLFGFPLTCRLFFEFSSFTEKAVDFFKRPLYYLRFELNDILSRKNDQSAALILVLLCEGKIKLPDLESPNTNKKVDEMLLNVTSFTHSATRSGIAAAARNFRGTFLSRGDSLSFAHSSIYEACACALYQFNPSFVLNYCSLDFLYERLKPGHESGVSDRLHLFVSEEYYHIVVTRLIMSLKQSIFSKTVAHPLNQNETFVKMFLEELGKSSAENKDWIQEKEKGRGFLYWVVKSKSIKLIKSIERVLSIKFTQKDISQALFGSVECDSLTILKHLVDRLNRNLDQSNMNNLLLVSVESSSEEMVRYLLNMGAQISGTDTRKRNFLHFLCIHDRSTLLKLVTSQSGKNREDLQTAMNGSDEDGRTPLMFAALHGRLNCFMQMQDESTTNHSDNNGDCLIHLACYGGNKSIVERTLTSDNINSKGYHGDTPTMIAAKRGKSEIFDLLLSNNADINLIDDNGKTLLHLACHGGSKHIVGRLLTSDNINSRCYFGLGLTPIMAAAFSAKSDVFDLLMSNNADRTLVDGTGDTLLHYACYGGSRRIVEDCVTSDNINSRGQDGRTPIMTAAFLTKSDVFDLLLSQNADRTLVDEDGYTLLHHACIGGSRLIVERLVTLDNINSRGQDGRTPIMAAAFSANTDVFELLYSQNADTTLADDNGHTLLHLACIGGSRCIVERLVTSDNINSRGQDGRTPIMKAVESAKSDVFYLLFSMDADTTLVDDSGETLLHLACIGGNRRIVEFLLNPEYINIRNHFGRTPIMSATVNAKSDVFDLLLSNGADTTVVDDFGIILLFYACIGGSKHIVERLVTPHNINSKDEIGRTPIMFAAKNSNVAVFDFLLSNNADITLVDGNGDTLLHFACAGGSKHIVERLLTTDNINNRGRDGRTPIMTAFMNLRLNIVFLLISKNADTTLVDDNGNTLLKYTILILYNLCQNYSTVREMGKKSSFSKTLVKALTLTQSLPFSEFDLPLTNNADTLPLQHGNDIIQQLVHFGFVLLLSKNVDTRLDENGNTLLHIACILGSKHIVEWVVTPDNINSRSEIGLTPIMLAAALANSDVFHLLLSKNADTTLVDETGLTLIHFACVGGNKHIVERLVTPDNINHRGGQGWTPIMIVASVAKSDIVDLLLSNNADTTLVDDTGFTLIHHACIGGSKHIVERIVTPDNINSRGQKGRTPIMLAAEFAKSDVFDVLLSNNADTTLVDDTGDTLIHRACHGGSKQIVECLVTPDNINSRGQKGRTPIMLAAEFAKSDVFDLLLSNNADTTLVDDTGFTLIHLVCFRGSKQIVERIVTPDNINSRGWQGRTPIMLAAEFAKSDVFDLLLSNNADATLVDDTGDTLIHRACHGGSKHIVECLVTSDNINNRGQNGRTPIMLAAESAKSDVFDFLLSNNADTTLVDDTGDKLIHRACIGGSKQIVERLVTPENINNRGQNGRTPIMLAAAFAKSDVFDLLLSNSADTTLVDDTGDTLIHRACHGGSMQIVERLVTPDNINSRGQNGRTPIMLAAAFAKSDVFDLLLSNSADTTLVDNTGDTLIHRACIGGSKHIVEHLVTPDNINSKNQNGRTPIMLAAAFAKSDVFDLLLSNSADTTLVDNTGDTLILWACIGGSKQIVEHLVTPDNINSKNQNGRTPIMLAAAFAKSDVFNLLLSNNADTTLVDDTGDTLIHRACIGGSMQIVERLVTPDNINGRGQNGLTPIMLAAAFAKSDVFDLLLSNSADTTLIDDTGDTLIHRACFGGSKQIVEHLVTPDNINSKNQNGLTPIMLAAAFAKSDVFDLLLSNSADTTLVDEKGDTLIHLACFGGSKQIVEHLVTPDNINSKNQNGRTPIMLAAAFAKSDVFDLLLSNSADTTLVDDTGDTLIHFACIGGSKHIVEHLVTPDNINSRGQIGRTPIMLAAAFAKSDVFDLLLSNSADTTPVDEKGDTLIHLACFGGSKQIVEHLVTPDNINSKNQNGRTPIMLAAAFAKYDVFDLLLSNSADTTLVDDTGDTLLHHACFGGSKQIVERLVTPDNINSRGQNGRTPIMLAAEFPKSDVFDLLLSNSADTTLVDDTGDKLIHRACIGGSKQIVERLVTPENINNRGQNGRTPIMLAAAFAKSDVFDLLLSNSADTTLVDDTGDTLLHHACFGGSKQIVERLVTPDNINSRGQNGRTPIMLAAEFPKSDVFDLLLSNSADTTLVDNTGDTLIHRACHGGSKHIVERLVTPDNINSRGRQGRTPIMTAVNEAKSDVFHLLLLKKADTTLVDENGDTVLHLACCGGSKQIVERLLAPANINSRDKLGMTPIMKAARNGHVHILELLCEKGADLTCTNQFGQDALAVAETHRTKYAAKYLISFLKR